MLNTSLLEILRSFDKSELKKFDAFVRSPYFNKKSNVTKLFKAIKKYSPEFKSDNLNREIVWTNLFPAKDFNYGVMKNLIYDLTQLAERFISEEAFANDDFRRNYYLVDRLSVADLKKLFNSEYKLLEDKLNSSKDNPEKYSRLADLKWLRYSVTETTDKSDGENISKISEFTIYSMLINLFKLYNNVAAEKMTLNYSSRYNLLDEFLRSLDLKYIMEYIKKNSKKDFEIINLYYHVYKALSPSADADSYYDFKNTLLKKDHLVSDDEKINLYSCLVTSLAHNKNIKNKPFEYNSNDKILLKKNLFLNEEGNISMQTYSLTVRMAAMIKDSKFIEDFMKTYTGKLLPSSRKNMELYGVAYLHFAKGEFGKSLELVNKINFDMLNFKFELKNLQIMLFYELKDFESLVYALDSYRHFASKNQFVFETTRDNIFRFINYVNTLYKLNGSKDKIKIGMLKDKVEKDTLNTKYWLIEKAEEM